MMKRILLITAIAGALFSCGSNDKTLTPSPKVDTIHTFAIYRIGNTAYGELVYLLTKEVVGFKITSDSNMATKQLVRDSLYFVPDPDSLKVGRLSHKFLPREFIIADAKVDIDSAFKKYNLKWNQPGNKDSLNRRKTDTTRLK